MKTRVAIAPIEWNVVDLAEACGFEIAGFVDKNNAKPKGEFAWLGNDDEWPAFHAARPDVRILFGVDPPALRKRLYPVYEAAVISAISPFAYVSDRARIGDGAIIQRGAHIMPLVVIGRSCTINIGTTIHHEAQLGDFCTVGPGVVISGSAVLEDMCYVGAGAVILQNVRIGTGAKVGAGAVVIADVDPGDTVVGIPARAMAR